MCGKIVILLNKSLIIALVLLSGIILLASDDTSALSTKASIDTSGNDDLHSTSRARLHEPTQIFEFKAHNVCSEKYQQCFNMWGEGNYNYSFNEVTAQGNYVKYREEQTIVLESGWWRAVDYIDASYTHVIFKAEPAIKGAGLAGFIVIEVFEGKTSDTGRVCVYGNLFDKQDASSEADADCTSNAYVKITSAG